MRVDEYASENENAQYFAPFSGMTMSSTETVPESFETYEYTGEVDHQFESSAPFESYAVAESPFTSESITEAEQLETAAAEFLEALHDEDFEDALDELMNEGAARVLADAQQWAVAPSEGEVSEALTQWMAPLVTEFERSMDGFAAGLENANLENISEAELDELLGGLW